MNIKKIPVFFITNYKIHLHWLKYHLLLFFSWEIAWNTLILRSFIPQRMKTQTGCSICRGLMPDSRLSFFLTLFFLVINQSPSCNCYMCAIVGFSSSLMCMCICAYRMGLYSPCLEVSLHMVEAMEPVQLARRVEKLQATLQVENPPPWCHHHKCHMVRSHINTRLKTLVQPRYQWKIESWCDWYSCKHGFYQW